MPQATVDDMDFAHAAIQRVEQVVKDLRVDLWICGHIHSSKRTKDYIVHKGNTTFLNAASINPVYGTGMCGCCRATIGGETKFVCVDGPEFDGHLVDFAALTSRLRMYDHLKDKCVSGAFAPAQK